jgi:hypothetical protein
MQRKLTDVSCKVALEQALETTSSSTWRNEKPADLPPGAQDECLAQHSPKADRRRVLALSKGDSHVRRPKINSKEASGLSFDGDGR